MQARSLHHEIQVGVWRGVIFSTFISLLQTENALTQTRRKSSLAKENWRKCLKLAEGKVINAEEEQWLYEGRKQLK